MQLRCLLGELGSPSISTIFAIPRIKNALGEGGEALDDHMDSGAERLIKELEWYGAALKQQKEKTGQPKL